VASFFGNVEKINCPDPGGQERLMSITPSCVHEKTTLVLSDGLSECFRAFLNNNVSPTLLARYRSVNLLPSLIKEFWHDDITLELRLSNLSLDAASVDGKVSQVSQQLLGTILAANEIEQLRGIIDESSPAVAINEGRVSEQ
jgi:hypothetical protein